MSKPRAHGTYACYQYGPEGTHRDRQGCRCDACANASRVYQRQYRAAGRDSWLNKKAGTAVRGLGWPR